MLLPLADEHGVEEREAGGDADIDALDDPRLENDTVPEFEGEAKEEDDANSCDAETVQDTES